ncbi:uncharacterized protein G2W53_012128 [Senna tora]|uniref:Uncharacterized protein n=1 Tax=Senna tora TaxID=362788 RepID=A0A834U105_9FABA|nr:uncharacterized protein G2W53_012128 [Senna tora]
MKRLDTSSATMAALAMREITKKRKQADG